jgi:hypothetical protein
MSITSVQSTIDEQRRSLLTLYTKQLSTRREDQRSLIRQLHQLCTDIHADLLEDYSAYQQACRDYNGKFHLLLRFFMRAATRYDVRYVKPRRQILRQRQELANLVVNLLQETRLASDAVEIRQQWHGSIAVVYNAQTGQTEWRHCNHGSVHGVFNPITNEVEWQTALHSGIYGVFNPGVNRVEWQTYFEGGVHGVYHPSSGQVEWKTASQSGVGGVYNPTTNEIEWKTSFQGAVIGFYDHREGLVKWIEQWQHGLAMIYWDSSTNSYLVTSSSGWYGDSDD